MNGNRSTIRLTLAVFLERAAEVHGSTFDYSKVAYKNNKTKVCIACPRHGEFWQTPNSHLQGVGCRSCKYDDAKISLDDFVLRSNQIHNNKFDYSKSYYITGAAKICIICPEHGEFLQPARTHLSGIGCKLCADKALLCSKEHFLSRAHDVHGNKYDYTKVVYTRNNIDVCIVCPKHGEFWQTPSTHYGGSGCSKCSHIVSCMEQEWLDSFGIDLDRQKSLRVDSKLYKVDGFDPATNTVYEFYGDFWHGNPKIYKAEDYNHISHKFFGELFSSTMEKESLLRKHYNVVAIWEADFITNKQNQRAP